MYASLNVKSKKALKEAVAAGQKITVFQPNGDLFGVGSPKSGNVAVEGPHFPQPHKWYAEVTLVDGFITKVR